MRKKVIIEVLKLIIVANCIGIYATFGAKNLIGAGICALLMCAAIEIKHGIE